MTPPPEESTLEETAKRFINSFGQEYDCSTRPIKVLDHYENQLVKLIQERERLARIDEVERFSRFGKSIEDGTDIVGVLAAEYVYAVNRIKELSKQAVKVKAVKT